MNEVEGELGHPFGDATSETRHAALMDFSRLAQATTREPGDIVVHGIAAAAAGIDLFSMASALKLGQPSVHVEPLRPFRQAMVFEVLRDASDRYAAAHGKKPRAFVACLGTVAEHTARVMWTVNALAAGGIEVDPGARLRGRECRGRRVRRERCRPRRRRGARRPLSRVDSRISLRS